MQKNPELVRVLIVDDEEAIRKLLSSRLGREGISTQTAKTGDEAAALWSGESVVVTDLKMPGLDGFGLMQSILKRAQNAGLVAPKVILITGHGEKEVAIQALKQGAVDYLEKPFDMDEFTHSVKRALQSAELEAKNRDLTARLEARAHRAEAQATPGGDAVWMPSRARAMEGVNEWLRVLARESGPQDPCVLITGESGTGKEGIARQIHLESARAQGPWVAVNCATFTEQLLESELFGHEKGAFTGATHLKRGLFELADGGTLFLDEIGEMELKLQARLLRVLQEKSFRRVGGTSDITSDVRVIAATNRDLKSAVQQGAFREDLWHRINRVILELAPLRSRSEDLMPMAEVFARHACQMRGKKFGGWDTDATARLTQYSWPGNVRELLNAVERAALLYSGTGPLRGEWLGIPAPVIALGVGSVIPHLASVSQSTGTQTEVTGGALVTSESPAYATAKKSTERAFERQYLESLLVRNGGNVSAAAREAKVDRSNLLRLMRKHGIKSEAYKKSGAGVIGKARAA